MAFSDVPKHFTDGTITFIDNTGTPLELTILHCVGDTAVSGGSAHGGQNRALSIYQTRGGSNASTGNTATRAGAHEPSTLSLTAHAYDVSELTAITGGTIRDWVYRVVGSAHASAAGFEAADSEVFSFTTELTVAGIARADTTDQKFTWTRVICTNLDYSEGEPNTFSISLQCLGTETVTLVP